MSVDEYLAFDERSPVKHEYVAGFAHPISDPSERHATIVANLRQCLSSDSAASDARVVQEPIRVEVERELHYYPDVAIVRCADDPISRQPLVVVEVASELTHQVDDREKFLYYQRLETLQQYLIVDENSRLLTLFDFTGDRWKATDLVDAGTITLSGVNVTISLADIYWRTGLRPTQQSEPAT
jgi:Uma2 family endonuclease